MLVQAILVFTIVWLLVWLWQRRELLDVSRKLNGIKPIAFPFIGHSYMFIGSDEDRMTAFRRFGEEALATDDGIATIWLGTRMFVVASDPVIAENLLRTCLEKNDIVNCLKILIGNGHIFAPVKIWRHRRKIVTPNFSPKNLVQFVEIFARQSSVMVEQLQKTVGKGAFSIWHYLTTYTLDSVCESTFGVLVNAQKQSDQAYLKAFDEAAQLETARLTQPWLQNEMFYKLTPAYTRHAICRRIICDFVDNIIKTKTETLKEENESVVESDQGQKQKSLRTFLELLIEKSGGDKGYTDVELREETLVLIIAGTDTSAVATAFTLVMLARYPDVQEKVYQELQDVFGNSDRAVTAEDLPRLQYMDIVIKEVLRLYPPVPVIVRKVVDEKVTLPSGISLVKDCGIMVVIGAVHRNRRYWGDDVDVFRPERFIDAPPKHPSAFMPFSHGPRACIGYQYAMMSMKTAMAALLRQYRVLPATDTSDQTPLRLKFDIMMKDVDNFIVQLEPRSKSL